MPEPTEVEWGPWDLDEYESPSVGGHSYCLHPNATTDHKRKAEKAHHATGKCQVVHYHPHGELCKDRCEVFGVGCPTTYVPRGGEVGPL